MNLGCTHDEIVNYLKDLKNCLNSQSYKLVVDFKRDKNLWFTYLYSVTKTIVRDVLLSLSENEFYSKVLSTNPNFQGHYLYIWNPKRILVSSRGIETEVELYVKTDLILDKNMVVVVSFHKFDDFDE